MKNLFIKNIFWLIAAVILFILAFRCGKSCNRTKPPKPEIQIKIDTVWKEHKTDTFYKPTLIKIIAIKPGEPLIIHDSIPVTSQVDTAFILRDYFAKAIYKDEKNIQYGKITINDTVTQNRIAGRGLIIDQNIPEITKTVTLTERKRNQIYLGIDGMADFKKNIYLGFSGALRNKKGAIWEAGALYGNDKNIYFFGSRKFLITFKK